MVPVFFTTVRSLNVYSTCNLAIIILYLHTVLVMVNKSHSEEKDS